MFWLKATIVTRPAPELGVGMKDGADNVVTAPDVLKGYLIDRVLGGQELMRPGESVVVEIVDAPEGAE